MKITVCMLMVFMLGASAKGVGQSMSLTGREMPLQEVFSAIKKQTGYRVAYVKEALEHAHPATLEVSNMALPDFMDMLLKDQPLKYDMEGKTIFISARPLSETQPADTIIVTDISGRVFHAETKEPLIGATVTIKGTRVSAVTDEEGRFSLRTANSGTLVISYVGFARKEIIITSGNAGNILLEPLTADLNEVSVVSTGYQFIPKERATGSFAQPLKEVFTSRVSTDVISRLNGITSGLVFNANTGNTINGRTDINIRGLSTINANDQPLIVVDNFPYNGDISGINPNDVESVTVLKDAAASAVWGVRAGNGVIVITTKRGRANQPARVSFTSNVTIMNKPDQYYSPTYLPSSHYIDIEHFLYTKGRYNADLANTVSFPAVSPAVEIMHNGGRYTTADSLAMMDALRNSDVRALNDAYFFRRGIMQQHALNVSGGTDKTSYYLSAGYDKNLQSLRYNDFERISLNMSNTFRPIKGLELTAGLYFINTTGNTDNTFMDVANRSFTYYPYLQYAAADGSPLAITRYQRESYIAAAPSRGFEDWSYRPLQELGLSQNRTVNIDYRMLAGVRYKLFNGLDADIKYQFQRMNGKSRELNPAGSFAARHVVNQFATVTNGQVTGHPVPVGGYQVNGINEGISHNFRAQLNYNMAWRRHAVNALAGYEISESTGESRQNYYYGYNDQTGTSGAVDYTGVFPINPSGTASIPGSQLIGGTTDRFRSTFVTGAYTYNDKYTFTLSGRIDGSNYFGVSANQKSVPLWAAGGKWDLDAEEFYKVSWLPVLKLTATYGYSGNLDKATTGITTFRYFNNAQLTGIPYADLTNIGNPDLQWERSRQIKVGIDFANRNHRIYGNFEYYFKKGFDLIGSRQMAPSTGVINYRGNYSTMKGSGFDLVLHAQPVRGAFNWKTSLLLNYNRDEVTGYDIRITSTQTLAADGINGKSIVPIVGRPVYSVYSLPFAGLDPENGDPMGYQGGVISKSYTDLNLSPVEDLLYHGPARPRFTGGLSNAFHYKDFSLLVNINFKLHYFFRRTTIDYYQLFGNSFRVHRDYINRWQAPGDEAHTSIPSMVYPANLARARFFNNSSVLVERGDHIRLQDISLAYTFRKERWRFLPFRDMQAYFYLNNIGLLWKANKADLDPDYIPGIGGNISPAPAAFSFGIKVNI